MLGGRHGGSDDLQVALQLARRLGARQGRPGGDHGGEGFDQAFVLPVVVFGLAVVVLDVDVHGQVQLRRVGDRLGELDVVQDKNGGQIRIEHVVGVDLVQVGLSLLDEPGLLGVVQQDVQEDPAGAALVEGRDQLRQAPPRPGPATDLLQRLVVQVHVDDVGVDRNRRQVAKPHVEGEVLEAVDQASVLGGDDDQRRRQAEQDPSDSPARFA